MYDTTEIEETIETISGKDFKGKMLVEFGNFGSDETHADCLAAHIKGFELPHIIWNRAYLISVIGAETVARLETRYTEERENP